MAFVQLRKFGVPCPWLVVERRGSNPPIYPDACAEQMSLVAYPSSNQFSPVILSGVNL